MTVIYAADSEQITFHAKKNYDQPFGPRGRAMTIAGFRIAQNSSKLSGAPMRRDVVVFLLSSRAVSWWIQKKWLKVSGKNENGKSLIRLTPNGLTECELSLRGQGPAGTDPTMVSEWVQKMLSGSAITSERKTFDTPL